MRGKKTNPELIEKAKALFLVKDSIAEVARVLNLPPKTVEGLIKMDDEFAELRRQQKKEMIVLANKKAKELLEAIDPEKAKSLSELSVTYGTIIDKNTVLSGEQFKSEKFGLNVSDNRQIVFTAPKDIQDLIKAAGDMDK